MRDIRDIREGDRVKFLNDTGTGVVVGIIDKDLVLVRTDEDEFEYPVLKKELIVRGEPEKVEKAEKVEKVERLEKVERVEKVERLEKVEKLEKLEKVEKPGSKIKTRAKAKSNIEEVDLHISKILDDISGLTSGEIVEIQLARFRTALDGAIKARQKKIIFIHGRGAGKLKREIHKLIDNEYIRCTYQDASFREYGYGATLVLIK